MTHGIPSKAKLKVIRPRWWESATELVYLDPLPASPTGDRAFNVYAVDGTHLGRIESYISSIDTKIAGTRLVRHGKRRTFWSTGQHYWKYHPSQASAIRELLDERREGTT